MFEGLKGKAEEALQRQRDEETKKQSEHDVNMMSVKQAIALAENNVDDAKKQKARLSEEMAKAKDELGEVEASKAADEKSLEETQHECQASAVEWENRQKEGSAEMAAIEKAKQILAERVTVLLQVKTKSRTEDYASMQIRANQRNVRMSLVNHFRDMGTKLHSLAMLNLVTVATQDP